MNELTPEIKNVIRATKMLEDAMHRSISHPKYVVSPLVDDLNKPTEIEILTQRVNKLEKAMESLAKNNDDKTT